MTIGGAVLLLVAIALLAAGGIAGFWLAERLGIASEYVFVWSWLRWPVTAAVIMLLAALAYYLLPDVEQEFKFITPGSVLGTVFWRLATWAFTQYAGHFGTYNLTYGSIGGVIVMLTWFYISGFIFLMAARSTRSSRASRRRPSARGPARRASHRRRPMSARAMFRWERRRSPASRSVRTEA